MFHGIHTQALHISSSVLYQVSYRASLIFQKRNTYGAGYEMKMSKCSSSTNHALVKVFWGYNILLCKDPGEIKSLLIDNLPRNHNLCENK